MFEISLMLTWVSRRSSRVDGHLRRHHAQVTSLLCMKVVYRVDLAYRLDKQFVSSLVWRNLNSLRPTQNGRHFADDVFKCIFLNKNVWVSLKISLKFVPKGLINNIPSLIQIMAWHRPGDKPLSEPMMVILLTHICVTRPQWVNFYSNSIWRKCPILTEVEWETIRLIQRKWSQNTYLPLRIVRLKLKWR